MKTLKGLMPEILSWIEDNDRCHTSSNFQIKDGEFGVDVFANCDSSGVRVSPQTHDCQMEVWGYWSANIRADWFDENGDLMKSEEVDERIKV